jgi:hypothetical protein
MGVAGLQAAREHALRLPSFGSLAEATIALYQLRDGLLGELTKGAQRSSIFSANFQPESLKDLERWYFELCETDAFSKLRFDRERFERAMAMYVGETAVRTDSRFEWFVAEFAFQPGTFEIGVRRPLLSWMLTDACRDHFTRPANKRRQAIWREFRQRVT